MAVNRLGEKGRWNLDELKPEFEELILDEAPIEISGLAFDEIDQITLGEEAPANETGPLARAARATATARAGDLFQIAL